jgi:hypothetical protein
VRDVICIVSYFIVKLKSIYRPGVMNRDMKGEAIYKNGTINVFHLGACMKNINLIKAA